MHDEILEIRHRNPWHSNAITAETKIVSENYSDTKLDREILGNQLTNNAYNMAYSCDRHKLWQQNYAKKQ